jgi:signal peptidase I
VGVLIFVLVIYLLTCASLYFLFPKAGVEASKAWFPGINFVEWAKLIGKKPIETLWLLFPIVNIFTFSAMAVDLMRSFGKTKFLDGAFSVFFAPGIFYKTAKDDSKYLGPILSQEDEFRKKVEEAQKSNNKYELEKLASNNPYHKPVWREWVESLFFAVFAAAFIRMFLIEAFVIPTPSMEGSLNVGDYLFVSKAHYGIRTPSTIAMIPLLHNRIPFINKESYLEKPAIKSHRLPALEKIEVGKPIVFNWPVGDSIYLTSKRSYFPGQVASAGDPELIAEMEKGNLITRPIDKRDHYIKRCLGVGGDKVQIIKRQVYINDKPMKNPKHMQFSYVVDFKSGVSGKKLDEWGIDDGDLLFQEGTRKLLVLDESQVEQLRGAGIDVVIFDQQSRGGLFPFDKKSSTWTVDDYGPIYVPTKGKSMKLDTGNIAMYKRVISTYEGNKLEIKDNKIYINGQAADSYTFKQDYYWAMGDNRHNSEDSRMWGFVPHDHIVGKPLFIWMSTKEGSISNGINWDRLFKYAGSKE